MYTTFWSQNIPEVISCWYSSTFQNCQHYTYLENKWRRGCLKERVKKQYFNWNRRTLYKFYKVQEPTNKTIISFKLLIKMRHSISHKVKFIVYKLYQNCKGQSTLSNYHLDKKNPIERIKTRLKSKKLQCKLEVPVFDKLWLLVHPYNHLISYYLIDDFSHFLWDCFHSTTSMASSLHEICFQETWFKLSSIIMEWNLTQC